MVPTARWSTPTLHPAPLRGGPDGGPSLIAASCWCGGAVDTERAGGLERLSGGADEPAALRRWLAARSADLSLELRVEAGGGGPPRGWLGLIAHGPTEGLALRALASAADDLGEALDAWAWWPTPGAPPPLAPLQLGLRGRDPDALHGLRGVEGPPRWFEAVIAASPAHRPARTARLLLRSRAASAPLRADLAAALSTALDQGPDTFELMMLAEPAEIVRLRQLRELGERAELEFSIHGERPLGAVLAEGLLHRFVEALRPVGLRLEAGPPLPLQIEAEALEWALQSLQIGAVDAAPDDDEEEDGGAPARAPAELLAARLARAAGPRR